ncbi:MAG: hypothetical protein RL385_3286 [Pseudomonadota bacterium]
MQSYTSSSSQAESRAAVAELTAAWPATCPDLILLFSSTHQDAAGLRAELESKYAGCTVVGCTTSGEHARAVHRNGSVSAAALYTPHLRWHAELIAPLSSFTPDLAALAVRRAYAALGVEPSQVDPREVVGVLLADGLSCKEEVVAAAVAEALDGAPLVGGSAGDDLAFKQTQVSVRGRTQSDAAVLLVARGPAGFFRILKHQHFQTRAVSMAVTRADPSTRRVYEIDGYPAAEAYARALGIARSELAQATFMNPVVITVQGQPYVRSVQSVNADDSLTFYCAVEEGWILDLAGHRDMRAALEADLNVACANKPPAGFLLGFNCILRALEANTRGLHAPLGETLAGVADNVIGFDTYGEVLDGLHINQTLVALLLERAA